MDSVLKRILFAGILVALLLSCGKASSEETVYHPESSEEVDSTVLWLQDHAHFHADSYYDVLNTFYGEQLKSKDYEAAASALKAVAVQEMYYVSFDPEFTKTLKAFDSLYADRLHWSKTQFVASHAGNIFMDQSEYKKAIACFKKISGHKPFNDETYFEAANLYTDIAFSYSAIGNQELALRYDHKALDYFDRVGSLTGKGTVYDNIAIVHLLTKNYEESEAYLNKSMRAYREAGDTANMFTSLHNRILIYEETGDPRKYTLIDSTYSAFVAAKLEDPSLKIALGALYVDNLLQKERIAEAKAVLQDIAVLVKEQNSGVSDDDYKIALAQYELASGTGILNTALMEEALKAVEESEHFQNQLAFCAVLKENAILHGDYKKALLYSEKEKTAMNGLANREMVIKSIELTKKHQMERKEQHIALQAKTILNKNITIVLLLTILGTSCLIAVVIYSRQKQKKIRLESQRAMLYTRQLLEKTEEERKRIAGDLHDSVSHELLNLKNTIHDQDGGTSTKIDAIINDIRIISRNLHPIMFEKVGLVASIEQLVERAQSIHNLMVTSDIEYNVCLSVSDELQVYRIVQEALSNVIKYAEAFAAKITVATRNDALYIEVRDNGKGFDVAETMSGSTAFGLHNILERSKAIGGFAKIHSDKNGTVITIEIKRQHENTDR